MVYVQHRPAPPLNDLIELLWYCADYHAAHRREIVFPSGSTALILALAHDRMPNWSPDLSNPAPVSDDGAALTPLQGVAIDIEAVVEGVVGADLLELVVGR